MKTSLLALALAVGITTGCPKSFAKEKAQPENLLGSVLLFVIPDCPIVNRYIPEINRIYQAYSKQGIKLTLIYPGDYLTQKDIDTHRKEYQIKPEGRLDIDYQITKKAGATITPEAVVYDANQKIIYRGRIDDWFTDYGDKKREPSQRNLRLALDALVAGKEVPIKNTQAIGCLIEY